MIKPVAKTGQDELHSQFYRDCMRQVEIEVSACARVALVTAWAGWTPALSQRHATPPPHKKTISLSVPAAGSDVDVEPGGDLRPVERGLC